jgi:hypothetical protein
MPHGLDVHFCPPGQAYSFENSVLRPGLPYHACHFVIPALTPLCIVARKPAQQHHQCVIGNNIIIPKVALYSARHPAGFAPPSVAAVAESEAGPPQGRRLQASSQHAALFRADRVQRHPVVGVSQASAVRPAQAAWPERRNHRRPLSR